MNLEWTKVPCSEGMTRGRIKQGATVQELTHFGTSISPHQLRDNHEQLEEMRCRSSDALAAIQGQNIPCLSQMIQIRLSELKNVNIIKWCPTEGNDEHPTLESTSSRPWKGSRVQPEQNYWTREPQENSKMSKTERYSTDLLNPRSPSQPPPNRWSKHRPKVKSSRCSGTANNQRVTQEVQPTTRSCQPPKRWEKSRLIVKMPLKWCPVTDLIYHSYSEGGSCNPDKD